MLLSGETPGNGEPFDMQADKHAADHLMQQFAGQGLYAELRGLVGSYMALVIPTSDYAALACGTTGPIKFGEPWQGKSITKADFEEHRWSRPGATRVEALTESDKARQHLGQTATRTAKR